MVFFLFFFRREAREIHAASLSSPSSLCRFPDGASAASSPSSALDRFPLPLIAGRESNLDWRMGAGGMKRGGEGGRGMEREKGE